MTSLKFRTLVLAAGLVAASLSTNASATVTSVTPTTDGYTFAGVSTGGVFSDFFNVAISSSDLVGTLSGSVAKKAGNNLTFTAYDIVDALNHSSVILHGTIGNLGLLGFDGTTGSGSYAVHIAGTSVGTVNYAGTLSVTSAVPEPETYGMMLAGLGLMGFAARRRKSV